MVGRRIEDVASCANLASLASSHEHLQRNLGHETADARWRHILLNLRDVGDVQARVEHRRMRSQSGRGATGWLRAIPTSYRTKMRNLDYRIACQRWLHLPLPILMAGVRNEPEPPCHCWQRGTTEPAVADRRGDHDMVCRNCNKLWRHNGVVRGLEGAARLAGLHTSRVVLPFCRHPGDISKKQPDLLIEDFHSAGEPTLADVTVTAPQHSRTLTHYMRLSAALQI